MGTSGGLEDNSGFWGELLVDGEALKRRDSVAKGGEYVCGREIRKEVSVSDLDVGAVEDEFAFPVSQSLDNFAFWPLPLPPLQATSCMCSTCSPAGS